MILADKIIRLRKKNGWSQEELAEKMNVSRQAVSKWEGAQTVPDLQKVLQLSELFGVTTDYLLKDEIEDEEFTERTSESGVKRVTMEEANAFIEWRKTASKCIAAATFLCIIAVIQFLLVVALGEFYGQSEYLMVSIGLASLFVLVAIAVAIFIFCGFKNAPYTFLDNEPFETEYGVIGMVKDKQKDYRNTYMKSNILATCLCVLSPISLLVGAFDGNEMLVVVMLAVTMLMAGIGVFIFITAGVRWASMQKLLKEGEYTAIEKRKSKVKEAVGTLYWLAAVAIYLGWSFATNEWEMTWLVWPIAGVLFAGVMAICNLLVEKNGDKK